MVNYKHGHSVVSGRNNKNPKWRAHCTWMRMRQRCLDANCPDYPNYGGRGITICKRWDDFANFYEDMGDPPPNLTLDRVNNDGNYTPNNCCWSTRKEQSVNRRNRHMITFNGRTMLLQEWAQELGIGHSGLIKRLREWPIERALSQKPDRAIRS